MSKANRKAAQKAAPKAQKLAKASGKAATAPKAAKATSKPQNAAKKAQPSKGNPYRVGGGYWASVEALKTLGIGKMHDFSAIIPAVRKAMGDGWKAFASKGKRNDETGKDAHGRVIQNVSVCARVKDYGKCLVDMGYVVKFDGRAKKAGLFKIGK